MALRMKDDDGNNNFSGGFEDSSRFTPESSSGYYTDGNRYGYDTGDTYNNDTGSFENPAGSPYADETYNNMYGNQYNAAANGYASPSAQAAAALMQAKAESMHSEDKTQKTLGYIIYGCVGLMMLSYLVQLFKAPVNVGISSDWLVLIVSVVLRIVCIVDAAILYSKGYSKWVSFLLAFSFTIFYPIYRAKVLGEGSLKVWLIVGGYFLCVILFFFKVGNAANRYGGLLNISSKEMRETGAVVYDTQYNAYKTYGDTITSYFTPKSVESSVDAGVSMIVIEGKTPLTVKNNSITTDFKNHDFKLVFKKKAEESQYNITGIQIDSDIFKGDEAERFWEILADN